MVACSDDVDAFRGGLGLDGGRGESAWWDCQ
jgi:hypothetical protein